MKYAWQDTESPQATERRNVRDNRTFALTLAAGFLFVGLLTLWKERHAASTVAFGLAVLSLLGALVVPSRLGPIRRGWMKIGEGLSNVTTPVLLAVVYYLVFTPSGIVRRLVTRRGAKGPTSWEKRQPLPPASRMERQF
ncbi:MAG TPA: SxtJ family membrane protein [Gemmatimonadaceae bacterium]|nr:SxtJ family membrane protein [Gemmatimonadaceae bacterium]